MSTFDYLIVCRIYYLTCVAGLIYCICTTGVSLLMFYGLPNSTDVLDCVFANNRCSKCKYIPGKMPYFRKTEIRKIRKNVDTTKKAKVIFGLSVPKNIK